MLAETMGCHNMEIFFMINLFILFHLTNQKGYPQKIPNQKNYITSQIYKFLTAHT